MARWFNYNISIRPTERVAAGCGVDQQPSQASLSFNNIMFGHFYFDDDGSLWRIRNLASGGQRYWTRCYEIVFWGKLSTTDATKSWFVEVRDGERGANSVS